MSQTDAFNDVLDPKVQSKADYGVSAKRKAMLSQCAAPLHVLDAKGVEVPHREYNPEDATEYPHTVECDGVTVHLHQNVKESSEDVFGDFGAADEDTDDVTWTVVDLTDGTVTLTVVGDWSTKREVPFEDFDENYEPIYLSDGQPRWGY